jgi:hypothetical protein
MVYVILQYSHVETATSTIKLRNSPELALEVPVLPKYAGYVE